MCVFAVAAQRNSPETHKPTECADLPKDFIIDVSACDKHAVKISELIVEMYTQKI